MHTLSHQLSLTHGWLRKLAAHRTFLPAATAVVLGAACLQANAQAYSVKNMISDGSVPATVTDANFLNPWGMSASPTWWISAANTGYNYVVSAATGTISFKVIVPMGANPALNGFPAGSVTVAGSSGFVLPNGTAPNFIFATLDGTISGWNSKLGTANALSQIVINNSASGASYTGLALLNTSNGSFLLAPNFAAATVEVYDSSYKAAKLAGNFTDPTLPANYSPYSIHVLGTQVIIAYAQRTAAAPYRTVDGAGNGVVDIFDTTGVFVSRAVTGGNLNSPWGVAYAPATYGIYSNDLLIGNFGDGKINVYDPKTFAYIGQLMDSTGKSLAYASLWDLVPGGTKVTGTTSVSGGDTSTVYFTAGLDKEAHGLLGAIANTTVAGSTPAFGFTTSAPTLTIKAGSSGTTGISIAPANGFSGTVAFTCTGLPVGATCNFAPPLLTVAASAAASESLTIITTAAKAELTPPLRGGPLSTIVSACLLPFALLLSRRRNAKGRFFPGKALLLVILSLAGTVALVSGCADDVAITPTPAGQSTVLITATSGAATQQTSVALTIQ